MPITLAEACSKLKVQGRRGVCSIHNQQRPSLCEDWFCEPATEKKAKGVVEPCANCTIEEMNEQGCCVGTEVGFGVKRVPVVHNEDPLIAIANLKAELGVKLELRKNGVGTVDEWIQRAELQRKNPELVAEADQHQQVLKALLPGRGYVTLDDVAKACERGQHKTLAEEARAEQVEAAKLREIHKAIFGNKE